MFPCKREYSSTLFDHDKGVQFKSRIPHLEEREEEIEFIQRYILRDLFRGPGYFDFGDQEISAKKSSPRRNLKTYVEVIEGSVKQYADARLSLPLTISFENNYLTDECVADICTICLKDDYIKKHLIKLDLSNNEITKESFPKIIDLINGCPDLTVDISCNSNGREVSNDPGIRGLIDQGRVEYSGAW